MSETKLDSDQISKIDQAIAAANARKASRGQPTASKPDVVDGTPKPKRAKLSPEDKAAREASKVEEKASRKAERDKVREAKRAERAANRAAPHMSKVEKAAAMLPSLDAEAQSAFGKLTGRFSTAALEALGEHLRHFVRVKRTETALSTKLTVGQLVRITGGDPRFVGRVATVNKVQRIRCYCIVPGVERKVYLFTSDVVPVTAAEAEADASTTKTGTEG